MRSPIAAALCCALALAVAIGFGRFGFTAISPLMLRDGTVGIRGEAVAQSLHFLGYFVGAAAVVRVRRNQVAPVLVAGLVASVVLLAVTGFAGASLFVYADRFLSGIASAVVMVMSSTWLFQTVGTGTASILYGGAGVGTTMAGECAAALAACHTSSRAAWLVLAGVAAVLALPPLLALRRDRSTPNIPVRPIATRPDIDPWRLVIVYAAGGFGYVVCATYLPTLVSRAAGHLDPIHVFSLFGLCVVPSCAFWIRVDERIGTRRALAANFLIQIIGTALPIVSSHPIALVIAAIAIGSTFMGVVAMAMAAGRRHAAGLTFNLMAVLTAAYALGQAAGPAMTALLSHTSEDLDRPLGLSVGVLAVAAAILLTTGHVRPAANHRSRLTRVSDQGRHGWEPSSSPSSTLDRS